MKSTHFSLVSPGCPALGASVSVVVLVAASLMLSAVSTADAAIPQRVTIPLTLVFPAADSPRGQLPVTATVFFEGGAPDEPAAAGWVLEHRAAGGQWSPWPSQVERWRKTGGGEGPKPGWTGQLSFFPPETRGTRLPLRLRQLAPGEDMPQFRSEADRFRLDDAGAGQWTVENGRVRFHLDGNGKAGSGQLAAVTLLTRDGPRRIATDRGPAIHRNPDINVVGRPWAHAHKWNPPEKTDRQEGPVVIEIIRSGRFPGLPEASLRIRYRFFAGRAFMESATEVELLADVSLIALRNDQLIFSPGTFSHFAWGEQGGVRSAAFADYEAINDHGDILKLWPETPWVLFWQSGTGVSAGTVRLSQLNTGPGFSPPMAFEQNTYIMNRDVLQSWMRPQVYLNVSWSREAGIHLPAGSRFSEVNLYCFSAETDDPEKSLVQRLYREAQSAPLVEVGEGPFPPAGTAEE